MNGNVTGTTPAIIQREQLLHGVTTTGFVTGKTPALIALCQQRICEALDRLRGLRQYALQQQQQEQQVEFPTVVMESLDRIQTTMTEALVFLSPSSQSSTPNLLLTADAITNAIDSTGQTTDIIMHPGKRPRRTGCSTTTIQQTVEQKVVGPKLRKPYKRRAERPLPNIPIPLNGQQYTKPEAMEILNSIRDTKDRTNIINHWIVTKRIPITTPITIHKYLREYQQQTGKRDWETDLCNSAGSIGCNTIPPPQNGVTYQRREACHILLPLPPKRRVQVISHWMANQQIPVKSMSAVERTLKKAATDGIESVPCQWGRWGSDITPTTSTTKATSATNPPSTSATTAPQNDYLPPYPPPQYNDEYTKLEAISILQKMTPSDRNTVLWKWIQNKQIPIRHPNSMIRILRDATQGVKGTTFSLDWKSCTGTTGHGPPYSILPPPRNGIMYDKLEFIAFASRFASKERNDLIRQWVHQGKIPYTCPLSANAAVVKAIKSSTNDTKNSSGSSHAHDAARTNNNNNNHNKQNEDTGQQQAATIGGDPCSRRDRASNSTMNEGG